MGLEIYYLWNEVSREPNYGSGMGYTNRHMKKNCTINKMNSLYNVRLPLGEKHYFGLRSPRGFLLGLLEGKEEFQHCVSVRLEHFQTSESTMSVILKA